MTAPTGNLLKGLAGILLGSLSAFVVALALGGAYRESEILDVLLSLSLPPLVLFFVYRGSEKRFVFCVGGLLISAVLFDLSPVFDIPRVGLGLVLMTIASMAIPVLLDLSAVDMGRQIRVAPSLARMTQVAFLIALFPFAAWKLSAAHSRILLEDQKLVGELALKLQSEGNTLVVEGVDAKTSDRALRRLAIRAKDRTYQLSDADVESVRDERTFRKTTGGRASAATKVTWLQEERMRLILKLQGTGLPDDVVLYSHRGPLTIYEEKVALTKPDKPGS